MPSSDPVYSARSRLANLHVGGHPDPHQVTEARRDLSAAHVEKAIAKALAAAPPLTAEQRSRLAGLLAGGAR